ncbi:MAG: hypothetical protein E6523_07655, partial [Streptococcus sp.]|nr:hypothetical protein [Streptococcus sp.]
MRTKDFIYYASAAVLMAVTTQVASADEVATQMPTVTEGNQYQPATAADIFGGGQFLHKSHHQQDQVQLWRQHLQQQVRWQTQVLH